MIKRRIGKFNSTNGIRYIHSFVNEMICIVDNSNEGDAECFAFLYVNFLRQQRRNNSSQYRREASWEWRSKVYHIARG
jgi:hypothetical protein